MQNDLNIRTVMSKDTLPVTGAEQVVYALVEIKAGSPALPGGMPANFGLVLDRSGSMDGEKLEHLKEAVGYVVDRLGENDRLSVTIFDDLVETLIPASRCRTVTASSERSAASSPGAAPRSPMVCRRA